MLGQEDGGGGAHGLQHDDDYVHYPVAVSDGGHGGRAEGGDHELIHIAHQQLQQQLRENGQGEVKDPAGLGENRSVMKNWLLPGEVETLRRAL